MACWSVDSLSTSCTWLRPKARPCPVARRRSRSTLSASSRVFQPSVGRRAASEFSLRVPAAVVNAPTDSAWSCQPVPVPGGQPISQASLPWGPSRRTQVRPSASRGSEAMRSVSAAARRTKSRSSAEVGFAVGRAGVGSAAGTGAEAGTEADMGAVQ
ncbi:hypothetical protein SMD44_06396 [Streptomyces alboflavus]|uniref:Uncharacterized protein n=1 Tax=Streptomyces alboflavus TaxID=67267 RepID=A0A1Z1WKD5_9ACTN|nr:hypothetical protein SMD44_06396 [Streptomyces alboflavus]